MIGEEKPFAFSEKTPYTFTVLVYYTPLYSAIMNTLYRTKQVLLLLGDAVSLFLGVIAALYIRRLGTPDATEISLGIVWFGVLIALWIVVHYINGLYDISKLARSRQSYPRILQAAVVNLLVGIIFFYVLPGQFFAPKTILVLSVVCGYTIVMIWRLIVSFFLSTNTFTTSVLFIGDSAEMQELASVMQQNPGRGYRLAAWISPPAHAKDQYPDTTTYDSLKAIRPAVSVHAIDVVVIAEHARSDAEVLREVYELLFWRVHITSLTSLYEMLTGRIPPHTFSESWFLDHLQHGSHPVYDKARRGIDIIIGCILLLLLIALFPLIALAIRINSRGPVLFKQERVGMLGTTFSLYKFRSMYALSADGSAETDGVQFAQKDDARITRVGSFLRKTRMDELPQAINLLKGDLSIIGPRPERPEIVTTLEGQMPYYTVRHIIKPGITGWAQINQHYTDTLEQSLQKLQYDLYYIKNRSILLDLSIMLKTVNVVLRGMGQ